MIIGVSISELIVIVWIFFERVCCKRFYIFIFIADIRGFAYFSHWCLEKINILLPQAQVSVLSQSRGVRHVKGFDLIYSDDNPFAQPLAPFCL